MSTPFAFAVGETNNSDAENAAATVNINEDPAPNDQENDSTMQNSESDTPDTEIQEKSEATEPDKSQLQEPLNANSAPDEEVSDNTNNGNNTLKKSPALRASGQAARPGKYVMRFKKTWEDAFGLSVDVYDAEGNSILNNPVSTFENDTVIEKRSFSVAPTTVVIKLSVKDPETGEAEELEYTAPFVEFCTNEEAVAVSNFIMPGSEILFCLYSIERVEDGAPMSYVDTEGNVQVAENVHSVLNFDESGWYGVKGYDNNRDLDHLSVDNGVDVNLIIGDGNALYLQDGGIQIGLNSSLTIWGQAEQSGEIICYGDYNYYRDEYTAWTGEKDDGTAGITVFAGGKLTINGGRIEATGASTEEKNISGSINNYYSGSAGIGVIPAYGNAPPGELEINGGYVKAKGVRSNKPSGRYDIGVDRGGGAGIGGGWWYSTYFKETGKITINGGRVEAEGAIGAAGIGGGAGGNSGDITITGGQITATGGGYGGAGIGGGVEGTNGNITISSGYVKAMHFQKSSASGYEASGAGIGAGGGKAQGGTITISGDATVYADGSRGAGIGGGGSTDDGADTGKGYDGGTIIIKDDPTVAAVSDTGAGIGGGGAGAGADGGSGGNITISGGNVMAVSTQKGAGIGGGNDGPGGNITINGGDVTACGGNSSRGVLEGFMGRWNDISDSKTPNSYKSGALLALIIDQLVTSGTWAGAGIGGGDQDKGGNVIINGGIVTAVGGMNDDTKAIGHGHDSSGSGNLGIYEHSKTTYGHLDSSAAGGIKVDGVVHGPDEGRDKAQNNTYAKIEPGEITVRFDLNGHGSEAQKPDDRTVTYGGYVRKPQPDPDDKDYFFAGWYKDKACKEAFDFNKEIIRGDTTVYARWIPKRTLKIKKDWNGADAADLPKSLTILYWLDNVANKAIEEKSSYYEINLNADNNWTGEITVSDEAVLTLLREPSVEGFRAGDTVFSSGAGSSADITLSPNARDEIILNLRDKENSQLSGSDFDAIANAVKSGNAAITLNNLKERVYSVKKVWDLPESQKGYVGDVRAVLQHKENGNWKTLQTITLKTEFGKTSAEGQFEAVLGDGKDSFEDYRIRELDKNGDIVLSSSDDGGSEDSTAVLRVQPFTDTTVDMKYQVSYQEDAAAAKTTITNKAEGITHSVKVRWLDHNGNEDTERPEKVTVDLYSVEENAAGKKIIRLLANDSEIELSEENGWLGEFTGQPEDDSYEARELSDGDRIYARGDAVPSDAKYPEGKAVFKVTKNGRTRTYEYDVTLEVDKQKHLTTITNKRTGIIYSVRKEWDVPEGSHWPSGIGAPDRGVYAVLQHRTGKAGGSETWENVGDYVRLEYSDSVDSDGHVWAKTFPAVAIGDDFSDDDYRVREFVRHIYDKEIPNGRPTKFWDWSTFTFFDPDDGVRDIGGGIKGRILLAEDDADNTGHLKPSFFARELGGSIWGNPTESPIEDEAQFNVTYSRDENGNFVITNHQEGQLSVEKKWVSDDSSAPHPESVKVVLQKKTSGSGSS